MCDCCIGKWNPNEYQLTDMLKIALLNLEVAILVRCLIFRHFCISTVLVFLFCVKR